MLPGGDGDGMLPDLRFVIGATLAAAMLGLTAIGLLTAARLTGHSKVGPLEASRSLPFDGGAHWNQFYHPDGARRFADLARKREVAQSGLQPSDSRPALDLLSPIAPEAPDERPAEASLSAATPPAALHASIAPIMEPSTDATADQPAPAVLAMPDDDRLDAGVQVAEAEGERRHAPAQSEAITAEGPAADAAAPPALAAAPVDRLTRPTVDEVQGEPAEPASAAADNETGALAAAPTAAGVDQPRPGVQPPPAPDPIAPGAPRDPDERKVEDAAPAATVPAIKPAAKRGRKAAAKAAPRARAAAPAAPRRARIKRPIRRNPYATHFTSRHYYSPQYAPRRAGRRQAPYDQMGQPF